MTDADRPNEGDPSDVRADIILLADLLDEGWTLAELYRLPVEARRGLDGATYYLAEELQPWLDLPEDRRP